MGGEITFYRQFILSNDYELFVASDQEFCEPGVPCHALPQSRLLERLKRTRLSKWAHDYSNLVHGFRVPPSLLKAAIAYKPDIIYTVGGGGLWQARMARALAKKLRVPFAAHFMDWSTFNFIGHSFSWKLVDQQFRNLYRDCDLAFCICEGMRDELGPHSNAHVHYPICVDACEVPKETEPPVAGRFRVTFAGNLGEWYGELLRELVQVLPENNGLEFRIFGKHHRWPVEFESQLRARGIYRGFLPFNQLSQELANTDALFLMMGFGKEAELIERTSFKTKFLEYLAFQKPIIVWGPEYCTAVKLARQHDCAVTCVDRHPHAVVRTLQELRKNLPLQQRLVANANRMYENIFDPKITKAKALRCFVRTIEGQNRPNRKGIRKFRIFGRLKTSTLAGLSLLRRGAVILTYHRVVEPENDPHMLCVSPRHFAEHLEIARRYYNPMPLRKMMGGLQDGEWPRRGLIFTFDDGYADNLINAKGILEKHEIPATVFVTTGGLGSHRGMWEWDLAEIFFEPNTLPKTLKLTVGKESYTWHFEGANYENQSDYHRHRAWSMDRPDLGPRETVYRAVYKLLRPLPQVERQVKLTELAGWASISLGSTTENRTMTDSELIQLAQDGLVEVGAHSVTHPVLSTLPLHEQKREIFDSKTTLEDILQKPISSFAYPYGSQSDYSPETASLVREAGFACACSTQRGLVRPGVDQFSIPRITVADWDGDTFARILSETFLR